MSSARPFVGVAGGPERCGFAVAAINKIESITSQMAEMRQDMQEGSAEQQELAEQRTTIRKIDQNKMYLMGLLDDCVSCERYPGTRINFDRMEMFGCLGSQTMINDVIRLRGTKG